LAVVPGCDRVNARFGREPLPSFRLQTEQMACKKGVPPPDENHRSVIGLENAA
jgi:hypothetical protein